MRLGKNKKKQWRRCAPGIEEEIIKSNQLKEIDEASFEVTNKLKAKELKYSTVPRIITKKIRKFVKEETIDLWAKDSNDTQVLSKKQKSAMEHKSKYVKPNEIIHPGTSWFPVKSEHDELLEMLEKDETKRIVEDKKFTMKIVEEIETKTNEKDIEEEETAEMEESTNIIVKKNKPLTSKERKRKLMKMNLEMNKQKERTKQKEEAHELRNIPKLCKEIKRTKEEQKKKNEAAKELKKQKAADKIFREQIHRMPFQLPSELAPNLRSVHTEGDLLQELCDKVNLHRYKAGKPKKMRNMKKLVKKKGLV